jgi:Flp pilus assembly protein TadG
MLTAAMTKLSRRLRRLSLQFLRSEQGVAAPLLGILLLLLIGCMGLSIDTGRAVLVKARLVDALDAAGLAVGARLSTTDYSADALRFVTANFKSGYASATVTNVTATPNSTKDIITLSAKATMPTTFMKLFGTRSVTVAASSEIRRSTTGLELVMVLDNTGSMDQSNSMPSLKASANSLLDILFGSQSTATDLFVGLVPFSQTVNIGTWRFSWVNFVNNTKANWKGCVMARDNGLDQTDTLPTTTATKFSDYYYPGQGGSKYCPQEVTPMTNVKSTISAAVNKMTADGNTHINLGAVWGWRLLSPTWRGQWGSAAWGGTNLPLNYNTPRMTKAVVIMTDGDNTMTGKGTWPFYTTQVYTAYGYESDGKLGTTTSDAVAEAELDKRLSNVCTNMKKNNIIVYTVAFNNPTKSTKTLLQNCATSTSYYFDAGNQAALATAFQTIGDSLSNLRVSK